MSPNTLAPYVLQTLAKYQFEGRMCSLDDLAAEIRVRRADLRRTVSALHREGFVDALRMRLTLSGFALARAVVAVPLPELRSPCKPCEAAA
ncbi:MAG: hypothetical protein HY898_32745 [Deltaproteobacteria bacterium]|nr:hypothetical protein [Deltaproteobacteria bacterium]